MSGSEKCVGHCVCCDWDEDVVHASLEAAVLNFTLDSRSNTTDIEMTCRFRRPGREFSFDYGTKRGREQGGGTFPEQGFR